MTQPTYKQLRRPRSNRLLGGVCAGIAHYFGVDPVVVRVAYAIVAVITGGAALIAYPILWIVMPEE